MSDFSGEFGPVPYTGNIGVRYVETDNTFDGFETQVDAQGRNGIAVLTEFKDDYSHTLPMANIAFELSDDIKKKIVDVKIIEISICWIT